MNINSSTDTAVGANAAIPQKPMTILVGASVPPGSFPGAAEIIAKASFLGASLAFPERVALAEHPGLVPGAFAEQQTPLEYPTASAGSESDTHYGGLPHVQRAAHRKGAGVHPGARAALAVCA